MAFKEFFSKYKVYTIISIIAILLLVAGGVTAGLLIGKQGNEQLNVPALAADFTDTNGLEYTILSSTDLTVSVSGYSGSSTTVVIPETVSNGDTTYTVTTIAGGSSSTGAFANETTLTSITIPSTITTIRNYAFYNCTGLTEINFNATNMNDLGNVNGVFSYAGQNGTGITVNIGANVTKIPAYLFYPYYGLIENMVIVNFAENSQCASIGEGAFRLCSGFTSITIPNSIISIGEEAFNGCYDITSVYYLGDINAWVSIDFGSSTANPLYYADNLYLNGVLFTGGDIVLDTVTSIGAGSFYNQAITSVTIGNQVTSIGDSAFYNCTGLTSVTIENGVTSIGERVFYNCIALTSITIPDSITSIGESAFYGCGDLSTIVLGNGLTEIGYNVFSNTPWLTDILSNFNGQAQSSDGAKNYLIQVSNTNITSYDLTGVDIIAGGAFYGCNSLTSITIPNSVISIGERAFYNCTALTEINFNAANMNDLSYGNLVFSYAGQDGIGITVNIGTNVEKIPAYLFYPYYNSSYAPKIVIVNFAENNQCKSIGEYAFEDCSNLIEITIPDGVTSIGESAFRDCSSLTEITIPDSVTNIGGSAFSNCTALTEINFNAINMGVVTDGNILNDYPFYGIGEAGKELVVNIGANVERIPARLFYYSENITEVTFAENSQCKSVGEEAFYRCSTLAEITIPDSVTSIGNNAFRNCSRLISFTIPDSVTSIGESTFYYCSSLTEITIPDSVTSIGNNAFRNCSSLISFTIPESITSIGEGAFEGCTSLTEINFNATNMNDLSSSNRVFYDAGQNGTGITVNIGANVTKIPAYLFNPGNSSYYAPNIVIVNFTENSQCESIGNYAFYCCTSLISATIGNSVTSIGEYAFRDCSSLTEITIPDSVTSIGDYAFYNCTALTEINFNAINMSDLYSSNYVFSYAGQNGTGITVNIGANVTKIPAYLFCPYGNSSYAPNIVTVTFAENSQCEIIGNSAFSYCSSLTSITIPDSVTSIGEYAFSGCSSLTSITLPDSVTSIGNSAFRSCSSLTSITIPNSVASIGNYAFYYCTALTEITIPDSVTSIGNYAFYNCTALTEINFNATNMNDLSSSNRVFYCAGQDGTGITVNIGANVTKIPAYLFYPYGNSSYAPKIVTVNFAQNSQCESIGEYAFYRCSSLNNVYFYNDIQNNTSDDYIGRYAFYNNADTVTYWVKDSTSLNNIRIIDNDDSTKFTNSNFQVIASLTITTDASLGQILINGELTDNYYETLMNGDITLNNVIAVPKANCAFLYWLVTTESGSTQVTDNPLSMTITETTTITAVFSNSLMEGIGVTALGGGQVRMGGYEGDIDDTTQVTLNAICYSGYTFDGWYTMENGVLTKIDALGNSTAVTINASTYEGKIIIARFVLNNNENVNQDIDNS